MKAFKTCFLIVVLFCLSVTTINAAQTSQRSIISSIPILPLIILVLIIIIAGIIGYLKTKKNDNPYNLPSSASLNQSPAPTNQNKTTVNLNLSSTVPPSSASGLNQSQPPVGTNNISSDTGLNPITSPPTPPVETPPEPSITQTMSSPVAAFTPPTTPEPPPPAIKPEPIPQPVNIPESPLSTPNPRPVMSTPLIIFLSVLILGAGAAGAYFWFNRAKKLKIAVISQHQCSSGCDGRVCDQEAADRRYNWCSKDKRCRCTGVGTAEAYPSDQQYWCEGNNTMYCGEITSGNCGSKVDSSNRKKCGGGGPGTTCTHYQDCFNKVECEWTASTYCVNGQCACADVGQQQAIADQKKKEGLNWAVCQDKSPKCTPDPCPSGWTNCGLNYESTNKTGCEKKVKCGPVACDPCGNTYVVWRYCKQGGSQPTSTPPPPPPTTCKDVKFSTLPAQLAAGQPFVVVADRRGATSCYSEWRDIGYRLDGVGHLGVNLCQVDSATHIDVDFIWPNIPTPYPNHSNCDEGYHWDFPQGLSAGNHTFNLLIHTSANGESSCDQCLTTFTVAAQTATPTPTPPTTTPTPPQFSCQGLTLNGKTEKNITISLGQTVTANAQVSHYGLIAYGKTTSLSGRVANSNPQTLIKGFNSISGSFTPTQAGIYVVETNAFESSACDFLCSPGSVLYQRKTGVPPSVCDRSVDDFQEVGPCTSTNCIKYVTVNQVIPQCRGIRLLISDQGTWRDVTEQEKNNLPASTILRVALPVNTNGFTVTKAEFRVILDGSIDLERDVTDVMMIGGISYYYLEFQTKLTGGLAMSNYEINGWLYINDGWH